MKNYKTLVLSMLLILAMKNKESTYSVEETKKNDELVKMTNQQVNQIFVEERLKVEEKRKNLYALVEHLKKKSNF